MSEVPGRERDTSVFDFRNKTTLQAFSQTARTHFTADLTQTPLYASQAAQVTLRGEG